jgi:uncharacterized protein (DUF1810 family)
METLEKFGLAQNSFGWDKISAELNRGEKQTHWMWFVFPQLLGLSKSPRSRFFGVKDLQEAIDYTKNYDLAHRLCCNCLQLLQHDTKDIVDILGEIDALKLKSSMTLFNRGSNIEGVPTLGEYDVFKRVLDAFFDGEECEITLNLLGVAAPAGSTTDDPALEVGV